MPGTRTFDAMVITVNVLTFQTLVACQKGMDKECRPRSDVTCYSDKHFGTFSPDNLHFIYILELSFDPTKGGGESAGKIFASILLHS